MHTVTEVVGVFVRFRAPLREDLLKQFRFFFFIFRLIKSIQFVLIFFGRGLKR
jgi:hypothetical protein